VKSNPAPNVRRTQWTQATELWVWAARGEHTFNWQGQGVMQNVDYAPHVAGKERLHPTQKPEVVCERHVRILTDRGHTVLDPFAGYGTYGAVCKRLGRECVSIEADAEWAACAEARINKERVQLELPATDSAASVWRNQQSLFDGKEER
jgi:protein-L-isoaspartate O-methyltransferase